MDGSCPSLAGEHVLQVTLLFERCPTPSERASERVPRQRDRGCGFLLMSGQQETKEVHVWKQPPFNLTQLDRFVCLTCENSLSSCKWVVVKPTSSQSGGL